MRDVKQYTILSAVGPAASGIAILCQDYRYAVLSYATDGGADAASTVKFQGAIDDGATAGAAPDFSAAASVTNMWDYVQVADLENGDSIDGDTGIAVATADDYRLVEMNVNGLKYLCATITARTAGEVTIKVVLFND